MNEIILVSDNPNKLVEYQNKLKQFKIIPYKEIISIEPIIENGDTFEDNAFLKASQVFKLTNKPCLADDSGILVESLPNALGVHSRRFSTEQTDASNNALLLKKLKGKTNRKAKFVSVICLMLPGEKVRYYRGELEGIILEKARGHHGFGYDPLFYLNDLNKTTAELNLDEKNIYSHRAKAIDKLLEDIGNEVTRLF